MSETYCQGTNQRGEPCGARPIREADMLLVVRSSLVVSPASSLPRQAKGGAALAIINRDPTPLDSLAEVVINGDAATVLTALVAATPAADPELT